MKKMNENKKKLKKTSSASTENGFKDLYPEDKEIYLFLRGGFAAK